MGSVWGGHLVVIVHQQPAAEPRGSWPPSPPAPVPFSSVFAPLPLIPLGSLVLLPGTHLPGPASPHFWPPAPGSWLPSTRPPAPQHPAPGTPAPRPPVPSPWPPGPPAPWKMTSVSLRPRSLPGSTPSQGTQCSCVWRVLGWGGWSLFLAFPAPLVGLDLSFPEDWLVKIDSLLPLL